MAGRHRKRASRRRQPNGQQLAYITIAGTIAAIVSATTDVLSLIPTHHGHTSQPTALPSATSQPPTTTSAPPTFTNSRIIELPAQMDVDSEGFIIWRLELEPVKLSESLIRAA